MKQPGQKKHAIDKSQTYRKKSGGLTRADPQSKEPSSQGSGLLDSGRGHTSRPMATHKASRGLNDVAKGRR